MSNIRVYELAKELGLENKAVIELCAQLGIGGKSSHSNSLSDDEADRVRRSVIREAVSSSAEDTVRDVKMKNGSGIERRMGNVIRRRKKSEDEAPEGARLDLAISSSRVDDLRGDLPNYLDERRTREEALAQANALFERSSDNEQEEEEVEQPIEEKKWSLRSPNLTEISSPEVTGAAQQALVPEDAQSREQHAVLNNGASSEELGDSEVAAIGVFQEQEPATVDGAEISGEEDPLDEVRRRHDVRALKVLGKIALPEKAPAEKKPAVKKVKIVEELEEEVSPSAHKPGKHTRKWADGGAKLDRGGLKPKKQVLKKDELLDYETDRDVWRKGRDRKPKKGRADVLVQKAEVRESGPTRASKLVVKIDSEISVGELAKNMGAKVGDVITKLMSLGVMAGVNQLIDFDTATVVASEFGFTTANTGHDEEEFLSELKKADESALLVTRPPVVTVMGHVDHGKTSLLDAIRKTSVSEREAGGITQHIGAYNVRAPNGQFVTFIDTPGHEAFTAMRGRGAKVTDVVVLVVAADDGVMPQTIEAINHARAAEVPIVVAVNKIDKEGANIDFVKRQLADQGLIPEDWGGQVMFVPVSARTRQGIDELLEGILLQSEMLELKANPDRAGYGVVIESMLDRGRGAVITVLVKNGTLREGDVFLVGATTGKIKALWSHDGVRVKEVGPGFPVEVLGVSDTPEAGDEIFVMADEAQARQVAEHRALRKRNKELAQKGAVRGAMSLETFSEMMKQGAVHELPVIVKADTQGSVEALKESLGNLQRNDVQVKVIHAGVGGINESDIQLAHSSRAVVVGFNVRFESGASDMADKYGVDVRFFRVIYELLDSLTSAMLGLLAPTYKEKSLGRAEVRTTFKVPRLGTIAGSYVLNGIIERGANVRLIRDSRVVFEGKMASLRRFKDDVKEVGSGYECGIGIDGYSDIKDGDIIEVYKLEEVRPT